MGMFDDLRCEVPLPDGYDARLAMSHAAAEIERLQEALRTVEHFPFDVMASADADLLAVKEVARAALAAGLKQDAP